MRIHLGIEEDFRPARKAHPAIAVADLDALARLLSEAGHEPTWDDSIPEVRRFYVQDPVGNRIELMQG
ncbi:hypothetical protein [Microvirga soli]|uniref:hypothetical protein n=1 Tax=Microvirga soli TaxID=1854496 RepID=UPI0035E3F52E